MPRRKGPSFDRAQVVAAAISCLEEGTDTLSLASVARRMGIKPPSLYNHVRNIDDLNFAVMVEGNRQLATALEDAIRDVYVPREVLLGLALAIRSWVLENTAIYAVMSRARPNHDDPEFAVVAHRVLDLFRRPLGQLGIEGDDATHAIRGLRAAMHGFVLLEAAGQFQLDLSTEASYRWLIETTLRGLPSPD